MPLFLLSYLSPPAPTADPLFPCSLIPSTTPHSNSFALINNIFVALKNFIHHIQPSISYKRGTNDNLYFCTPSNLQLCQRISSFSALKHRKKIISWLHTSGLHIRKFLHTLDFHIFPQKYTPPMIPYQIISFIMHNFHNIQSHLILSQNVFLIMLGRVACTHMYFWEKFPVVEVCY